MLDMPTMVEVQSDPTPKEKSPWESKGDKPKMDSRKFDHEITYGKFTTSD